MTSEFLHRVRSSERLGPPQGIPNNLGRPVTTRTIGSVDRRWRTLRNGKDRP